LAILFRLFGFLAPKDFYLSFFQSFDIERTRWRLFQKRVLCTKLYIYILSLSRYLCLLTISPPEFHPSMVSISALALLIRYIYYWSLQFLNNVISIKTEILLPHAKVTVADFDYPVSALWLFFSHRLLNNNLKYWNVILQDISLFYSSIYYLWTARKRLMIYLIISRWLWWVLLPYAFNSLISNHVEFLSQNYLFHIYSWKSKRSKYSHAQKKRNENFDFSCVYFAFSCDNFYFSDFRFNILTIHFLALISMHDEKQKNTNIQNGFHTMV
jgi:hypothetical protein